VIFRVRDRCNPSPHVDVIAPISQREIIASKFRHTLMEALDLEVYVFNSDGIRRTLYFAMSKRAGARQGLLDKPGGISFWVGCRTWVAVGGDGDSETGSTSL
jgi:hypothetical protein